MNIIKKLLAFSLLSLLLACSTTTNQFEIQLDENTISVSLDRFKKVEDSESYAKNFYNLESNNTVFGQIITVFTIPMSDDRKSGKQISENEFLEIFAVHSSGYITIQVRVDKGNYWVLSRQSFDISNTNLPSYPDGYYPEYESDDFIILENHFQNEIDNTRSLLNSSF